MVTWPDGKEHLQPFQPNRQSYQAMGNLWRSRPPCWTITVEPVKLNTCIHWTPAYIEQFFMSQHTPIENQWEATWIHWTPVYLGHWTPDLFHRPHLTCLLWTFFTDLKPFTENESGGFETYFGQIVHFVLKAWNLVGGTYNYTEHFQIWRRRTSGATYTLARFPMIYGL